MNGNLFEQLWILLVLAEDITCRSRMSDEVMAETIERRSCHNMVAIHVRCLCDFGY